jgi:hypothetical protein
MRTLARLQASKTLQTQTSPHRSSAQFARELSLSLHLAGLAVRGGNSPADPEARLTFSSCVHGQTSIGEDYLFSPEI